MDKPFPICPLSLATNSKDPSICYNNGCAWWAENACAVQVLVRTQMIMTLRRANKLLRRKEDPDA